MSGHNQEIDNMTDWTFSPARIAALCNMPIPGDKPMYTAQRDAHGNVIVCKGSDTRRGYRIVFTGSYADCLRFKVEA
jgi:hypothetical protein